MEYIFKKFGGEQVKDLAAYFKELLEVDPTLTFSIGVDSTQLRYFTKYAVVIVIHSPIMRRGAHILFLRFKTKKYPDLFTRLWKEAETLAEVGDMVHEQLEQIKYKRMDGAYYHKLVDIHMDFNPDAKFKSNQVCVAAQSWLTGMGFKVMAKPNSYSSSCAADLLCK